MDIFNVYTEAIAISSIIIISYFFSYVAKKTNIPSVLLLIGLGIGVQRLLKSAEIDLGIYIMEALELFGVVGLIMIVLEAALDLELKKEKKPLLVRSFLVALLSLLVTAFAIAYLFHTFLIPDFYVALLYAIPLSILSSAIIIPSVAGLIDSKKEFMIYESTFSDILGIMFFYFMIGGADATGTSEIVIDVSSSILLTIVLSLVISYTLVLLLPRLQSKVKLFFLISVLVLLYATGKLFHLSSLLIIMVFGLVLNNYQVFFKGKMKKLVRADSLKQITEDFHVVTMETAFVVRTFFFVIFGMTLDFSGIMHPPSLYLATGVLVATYVIRYLFLKLFAGQSILPQLWIAPRGLITVLLFFSIPVQFQNPEFNPAILLIVILTSSFIMSGGLMAKKEDIEERDELSFDDWDELDEEIRSLTSPAEKLKE
ncbi:sodium:proton exchanger [Fulvivirga sp. M361]|uniref:cation:proton antiporter domain-containing protein n=1 Tax=Fulvivirga sp. M361 TaxID=2594266 RepID=UPI00117A09A9|nr:cation:proton antiporter [Fulvivirga sp. M361]TRX60539.1 sodium:proton exchanger [Fulvivirga sp. M361]